MISLPSGTHIWIAAGVTDLRRGFTGLSAVAQTVLEKEPYSGHVFVTLPRYGVLGSLRNSALSTIDRHRGGGHPPTPATPPCVRVRTRRFERLR
jgi:hypothetical protein